MESVDSLSDTGIQPRTSGDNDYSSCIERRGGSIKALHNSETRYYIGLYILPVTILVVIQVYNIMEKDVTFGE